MYERYSVRMEEIWKRIADEFRELWNFPNYVGALDEKHARIQTPSNSGSQVL
jgi:hypothetical protein